MDVNMQSVIVVVSNLDLSTKFYQAVFEFPLIRRHERIAILGISNANHSQVLVLRENPKAGHPGGGTGGIRVLGFEVASPEELEVVAARLTERHALTTRLHRDLSDSVLGTDPDRYTLAVSAGLTGHATQAEEWADPDGILEALGW